MAVTHQKVNQVLKKRLRLLVIVLILSLFLPFLFSAIFPHSVFVVANDSMKGTLNSGDIVFVGPVGDTVENGSIIVFRNPWGGGYVVHRIVEVKQVGDNVSYVTKGDANQQVDAFLIKPDMIVGKVNTVIPEIGNYYYTSKDLALIGLIACVSLYLFLAFLFYSRATKKTDQQTSSSPWRSWPPKKGLLAATLIGCACLFTANCLTEGAINLSYPDSTTNTQTITNPWATFQSGIAGTSTIDVNEINADVTVTALNPTGGFAAYQADSGSGGSNALKMRDWNGTAWSLTDTDLSAQSSIIQWIRTASCPSSARAYERIIATLSANGQVGAQVWNGSSWIVNFNLGTVGLGAEDYNSFDLAYESTSGRAMLVYSTANLGLTTDLAYRIWNGTSWSSEAYINNPELLDLVFTWVDLEANPQDGSNELTLTALDSSLGVDKWIWNGTTWGNYNSNIILITQSLYRPFDAVYQQNSGNSMVVWGTANSFYYRIWNGTTWSSASNPADIPVLNTIRWISAKADPASNMVMAIILDGTSNLYSILWNGTTWLNLVNHGVTLSNPAMQCADFDWQTTGGKGLLVWSGASDSISYKTFTASSTWGSVSQVSNSGTHPWITLKNCRNQDQLILGLTINSNNDIWGLKWDGSSLSVTDAAFTTVADSYQYQSFDLTFNQAGTADYDYVLKINSQSSSPLYVRLKATSTLDGNLTECIIAIRNGTDVYPQITVSNGAYTQEYGSWVNLAASGTDYILLTSVKGNGTSSISTMLEITKPQSGVYTQYRITFNFIT